MDKEIDFRELLYLMNGTRLRVASDILERYSQYTRENTVWQ